MPRSRVFKSSTACLTALPVLLLAVSACKTLTSDSSAPTPDPSASTTAAASSTPPAPSNSAAKADPPPAADDGYKPLHPGYVNQRDGKGGFISALTAPLPVPTPPVKPTVFDSVPEETTAVAPKPENGHCGELDLGGGDKVELDCITDDYSLVTGAARPTASVDEMPSFHGTRKLPSVVDHRKDGTEGPMMSQGKTGACTAFSLVAAVDHAAAHFLGRPPSLSPMHAWARYHTPKMTVAESDNLGKGLTDLTTMPFDQKLANEWAKGQKRVDHDLLHRADAAALVEITNITRLDTGSMSEIKSALAAGQDVWFAIRAAHGLQRPKKGADGESMVPDFDYRKGGQGGHAILLAGYEDTPKGTFYLIHNSWGPRWGTEGYAWIWEKTLRKNLTEAYVVQAQPTDLSHAHHSPASHHFSNCHHTGLAPDAITTQCVPTCPDGGPRVNGVCPTAGQCPDGEVNLDGKCELSAPTLNKTLSNGVKVSCGLSGCTYVVPNGQESCSSDKGCTISCAAPRFMLGSGPRGLACNG